MLRFVVAAVMTLGVLVVLNGSVSTADADTTGLGVSADGMDAWAEFIVSGEVWNESGNIPTEVTLSGAISGTYDVEEDGTYYVEKTVPPNQYGSVTVTASYNGETATATTTVFSGGPPAGGF